MRTLDWLFRRLGLRRQQEKQQLLDETMVIDLTPEDLERIRSAGRVEGLTPQEWATDRMAEFPGHGKRH